MNREQRVGREPLWRRGLRSMAALLLVTCCSVTVAAPQANPTEDEYYPITTFELPADEVLEVGAVELLPNGKLALATRRGEIWLVDTPFAKQVTPENLKRFAHGLHEPLSLAWRDDWLYVTQRPDVSRVRDSDGDGLADEFEVVADGWEISGDYHEYAFGSKFDGEGNMWVVLCLTGSFDSNVLYRGWAVRVNEAGETRPTCSGVRSPGGIGMNLAGDVFYTDNQGPWNGTCHLKQLVPGKFLGHPGGFKWYSQAEATLGPEPTQPASPSRMQTEMARIPELEPPVIMFPYDKMGKSASGVTCDNSQGKFGPFQGQLFVSDQSASTVMRVFLEQVDGHYQGACFPFRKGFQSGNVATEIVSQGSMFVGGTNRGWGSVGTQPFALERLDWSGQVPFEIHEMRVEPDGFTLTFTKPAGAESAQDLESYSLKTYTYIYQSAYGSPEVDHTEPKLLSATVAADGLSVRLKVDGMQLGHVHELNASGIRSQDGLPLLHSEAYYTLNYLPKP